jgi:hypothetical protein
MATRAPIRVAVCCALAFVTVLLPRLADACTCVQSAVCDTITVTAPPRVGKARPNTHVVGITWSQLDPACVFEVDARPSDQEAWSLQPCTIRRVGQALASQLLLATEEWFTAAAECLVPAPTRPKGSGPPSSPPTWVFRVRGQLADGTEAGACETGTALAYALGPPLGPPPGPPGRGPIQSSPDVRLRDAILQNAPDPGAPLNSAQIDQLIASAVSQLEGSPISNEEIARLAQAIAAQVEQQVTAQFLADRVTTVTVSGLTRPAPRSGAEESEESVTRYDVYRTADGQPTIQLESTESDGFKDWGVLAGHKYTYEVYAADQYGRGEPLVIEHKPELKPRFPGPQEEKSPAGGTGTGTGGCSSAGDAAPAGLALLGLWLVRRPRAAELKGRGRPV